MEPFVITESSYQIIILIQNLNSINFIGSIILFLLFIASAFISTTETAYFSITPNDKETVILKKTKKAIIVQKLLKNPERLLATYQITKTLVNTGIVILSAYLFNDILINYDVSPNIFFGLKVILATFLILIFAEIIPKVYASKHVQKVVLLMPFVIFVAYKIFNPIASVLIRSKSLAKKKLTGKKPEISMENLSSALELTNNSFKENKKILKGIVSYGTTDVSEIMKPRVDIVAFSIFTPFNDLLEKIKKQNYSRIPIFAETFDNIKGVLFVKDLLPHFHKQSFNWQSLIRPAYFVPESKKINDLLLDFQTKKIHMAFVIDEYGGTNGIVTLEDVLEEIVGEIVDEFDYDEEFYKKLDDKTYVFEGKTLINDFYKIMKIEDDLFEDIRGDADTLAGLILEIQGEIPKIGSIVEFKNYIFKILAADKRRIKQIHVTLQNIINE